MAPFKLSARRDKLDHTQTKICLHRPPLRLYKFENGEEERKMEMAAQTASKQAKAQSKRRLMSQKNSEEDEGDQESEDAEEGFPSNSERRPIQW